MKKLFTAITTRYNSTAGATLRGLLTGGLHALEAPGKTKAPFAVISVVSDPTYPTMSDYNENPILQFSIFVDDYQLDSAMNIRAALIALYDDFNPTFPDGGHVWGCSRIMGGQPQKDPDIGYSVVIQYMYWFDESDV